MVLWDIAGMCVGAFLIFLARWGKYVRMTKDEAQRSRWTFYEAVSLAIAYLILCCLIFRAHG